MRSAGVASVREVGFDSGKMTGRSTDRGHVPHHGFRKRSRLARDADQHGGLRVADHVGQADRVLPVQSPARDRAARLHEWRLERQDARHVLHEQAVPIDEIEARAGLRLGQAVLDHGAQQERADAGAGAARAQQRHPLLAHRHAGDVHGREQRAGGDHRRALDVVVEGAEPVAVAIEQPSRVVAREILPLQQHMRPALGHGLDERLDEIVVPLAAHALVAPADVERVGQAFRVVGADIEEDRQRGRGVHAAAAGVERELADRDAHPAGALVAKPQDALAVGDHDGFDVVEARMGQDAPDALPGGGCSRKGRAACGTPG